MEELSFECTKKDGQLILTQSQSGFTLINLPAIGPPLINLNWAIAGLSFFISPKLYVADENFNTVLSDGVTMLLTFQLLKLLITLLK